MRKLIGKQSEDQVVELWMEILAGAKKYAEAKGFRVVLGYGDPPDAREILTVTNLSRKREGVEQGGTVPLQVHPGCDISESLVQWLNYSYREALRKTADTRR